MIKAASLPISTDLYEFSKLLTQHGLSHRINEESGQQVIWVSSQAEAEFLQDALLRWQAAQDSSGRPVKDNRELGLVGNLSLRKFLNGLIASFYYTPVTLLLFLVCLVVAVISRLGAYPNEVLVLFYPQLSTASVVSLIVSVDSITKALQTLSPMFLHFGELHLVFNMLWLWYFGKQLEAIQPSWFVALLVISLAFVSNTAQYLMSESRNFGGMSGVIYGLMAYAWVIHTAMPRSYLSLNKNLLTFFVVALVAMEVLASSMIATAAHVGGLVSGLLIGVLTVITSRVVLKETVVGREPVRFGQP